MHRQRACRINGWSENYKTIIYDSGPRIVKNGAGSRENMFTKWNLYVADHTYISGRSTSASGPYTRSIYQHGKTLIYHSDDYDILRYDFSGYDFITCKATENIVVIVNLPVLVHQHPSQSQSVQERVCRAFVIHVWVVGMGDGWWSTRGIFETTTPICWSVMYIVLLGEPVNPLCWLINGAALWPLFSSKPTANLTENMHGNAMLWLFLFILL